MERTVRFLVAPLEMDLFGDEIIEYADKYIGLSIEDLGLSIVEVSVKCENQNQCVKTAIMKLFDAWKGDRFSVIGCY